jgi:hypothetical protein
MAGTGSGLLQPTKLIQVDDFMETIAPPGYKEKFLDCDAALSFVDSGDVNTASVIYSVPDGMTIEIIDVGVTFPYAFTFSGSNKVTLGWGEITAEDGTASAIVADTLIATAKTAGQTLSVLRGDLAFAAAYDTQAERQQGPGSIFGVTLATTGGTCDTHCVPWIRFKYVKKDNGTI